MRNIWRLDDALTFIRKLQPVALEAGYAISLGGSVLNSGFSWKDLDLICLSGTVEDQKLDNILNFFSSEDYELVEGKNYPGLYVYKFIHVTRGLKIDLVVPELPKVKPVTEPSGLERWIS